jgi:Domain of unknown function (DUF5666)
MKTLMQKLATGAVLSAVATTLACSGTTVSGPTAATTSTDAAQAGTFGASYRPAPATDRAGTDRTGPVVTTDRTGGRVFGGIEDVTDGRLQVAGKVVELNHGTAIWLDGARVGAATLHRGQVIGVEGIEQKDGTLLATWITILS